MVVMASADTLHYHELRKPDARIVSKKARIELRIIVGNLEGTATLSSYEIRQHCRYSNRVERDNSMQDVWKSARLLRNEKANDK